RKDRWGYDPRILKEQQVGHFEFYGPQPFDKGHMVRRENPGWGAKEAEALLGEEDSFIYTNAVPQMPDLNQKTWLSLENYVLQNAKVEGFKVNVFTGPVLREDDPEYEGVRVPLDFWKIVVAVESGTNKLLASAYLLTQEGMMPTEGFRYGPFKTYQVALKYVEELTDLKFPKNVRDADVFGQESLLELNQRGRMLEVREAGDIIL
ncbi:MAG TPA: DNA/RNA non-specific endonuclease, partial [Flavobacteriales bacterium]|nr:DNA/RNA non-specific endonuclease [Flavobacteriales bacterium]